MDTVIAAMEANHPNLTNQKTLYVEISRARDRAELVTNDRNALRERLEAATGERIAAAGGGRAGAGEGPGGRAGGEFRPRARRQGSRTVGALAGAGAGEDPRAARKRDGNVTDGGDAGSENAIPGRGSGAVPASTSVSLIRPCRISMVPTCHQVRRADRYMASRVPSAQNANGKDRVAVTIRVPEPLLRRIDRYIKARDVPISRNNWLLEAAVEKLARQQDRRSNRDGS